MRRPSSSNSSAAAVIEMPRSCSSAIQSEVACRARLAPAHRAGELDRAGIQQQLLGQRRLAGVGMRDDGERPAPRDLAFELALRRGVGLIVELC